MINESTCLGALVEKAVVVILLCLFFGTVASFNGTINVIITEERDGFYIGGFI